MKIDVRNLIPFSVELYIGWIFCAYGWFFIFIILFPFKVLSLGGSFMVAIMYLWFLLVGEYYEEKRFSRRFFMQILWFFVTFVPIGVLYVC